jgi:predicted GH43/DUF377 family glycosyl hydrolase
MSLIRSEFNPIISPNDVKPYLSNYEVIGVFNAGVTRYNGEVVLLLRVAERPINLNSEVYLAPIYNPDTKEIDILTFDKGQPGIDYSDSRIIRTPGQTYLTSISHLRVARSQDGVHFTIDERPAIFPDNEYEAYGIEDPRITLLDGLYYINYSAISTLGIVTMLTVTADFRSYERRGIIFHPDNKDVEIFPEIIGGKYYALHRPSCSHFGKPEVWLSQSPDLLHWGNHRYLMGIREGFWDEERVGGSAIPFRVEQGWLEIYHGADKNHRYCLGAVLLKGDDPHQIIGRSREPFFVPEATYEVDGFFGNVVFTCGVLFENNKVKIYYGAADTYMAYAEIDLVDIMEGLDDLE